MVPILAWRNIWRNPTRSWVVIAAIAIGIWAAIFMSGFATGMIRSYVDNAIANIVSHIQIHHPEYSKDYDVKFLIPGAEDLLSSLESRPDVEAASIRSVANGMISSSKGARGIRVEGIDPELESRVRGLDEKIREGAYFDGKYRNPILVSLSMAEKLNIKERSRVVLTFQDLDGEITAAAFRVIGLFQTGNKPFDDAHVFVLRDDLNRLLLPADNGNETEEAGSALSESGIAHELAIILRDQAQVQAVTSALGEEFPGLEVESYRDLSPDLQLYEGQIHYVSIIYLVIIMLALVFGIVNTMLMAVLERIRELGMLMAIGMNKLKVFFMIVLETLMLSLVGAPFGFLFGYLTVVYLKWNGINLSAFSETLQMWGMSEMVYFDLDQSVYWQVPLAVGLTAIVASIYPALKAIRLRPVEAIRKL